VAINQTGGESSATALLWDRTTAIPNIAMTEADAVASNLVYGITRETLAGSATSFSAVGDQVSPAGAIGSTSPFGPTEGPSVNVGFGYRGELESLTGVHLRARELSGSLNVFLTRDSLEGLPGSTGYANPYWYANNDPIGLIDPLGLRASDANFTDLFEPDYLREGRRVDELDELNTVFDHCGRVYLPECASGYLGQAGDLGWAWSTASSVFRSYVARGVLEEVWGVSLPGLTTGPALPGDNAFSVDVYGDSSRDFSVVLTSWHADFRETFGPLLSDLSAAVGVVAFAGYISCVAAGFGCVVGAGAQAVSVGAGFASGAINCAPGGDGLNCAADLGGVALSFGGARLVGALGRSAELAELALPATVMTNTAELLYTVGSASIVSFRTADGNLVGHRLVLRFEAMQ